MIHSKPGPMLVAGGGRFFFYSDETQLSVVHKENGRLQQASMGVHSEVELDKDCS